MLVGTTVGALVLVATKMVYYTRSRARVKIAYWPPNSDVPLRPEIPVKQQYSNIIFKSYTPKLCSSIFLLFNTVTSW